MSGNGQDRSKSLAGRIIKLVVLEAVGIALIVLGGKSAEQYQTYSEQCTEKTTGVVTNIYEEREKKKSTRTKRKIKTVHEEYNLITVTYYVDNTAYTKEATDRRMVYTMGEEMVVCYSPDDPSLSYVEALMPQDQQKFATTIGVCVIIGGILVFLFLK